MSTTPPRVCSIQFCRDFPPRGRVYGPKGTTCRPDAAKSHEEHPRLHPERLTLPKNREQAVACRSVDDTFARSGWLPPKTKVPDWHRPRVFPRFHTPCIFLNLAARFILPILPIFFVSIFFIFVTLLFIYAFFLCRQLPGRLIYVALGPNDLKLRRKSIFSGEYRGLPRYTVVELARDRIRKREYNESRSAQVSGMSVIVNRSRLGTARPSPDVQLSS